MVLHLIDTVRSPIQNTPHLLELCRLVQNDPAHHGACHSGDDDEKPDLARTLRLALEHEKLPYPK